MLLANSMNLIVFDIDDTLTKSEFQHQMAYVKAMKAFGITNINDHWKSYHHHTDSYILKVNYENNISKSFNWSFIDEFEQKMTGILRTLKPVSEIKGARTMLKTLMNHGHYAMTFATGSLLKPALLKLEQARIPFQKELVVGSNRVYDREGIVSKAIEQAKSYYKVQSFDHVLAVGDGLWDLKTAKNLDLHFLGIGPKNYADFKAAGLKTHISDWTNFDLYVLEEQFKIRD